MIINNNSTPSLRIGELKFETNLIQGPLAGVSNSAFRRLVWQYGAPAFCYSEMISCKTLIYDKPARHYRYTHKAPNEKFLCMQISGQDPLEISQAAIIAEQLGADLLDLNCGCPKPKIRSKGSGSRLLSDPSKLYQLLYALKRASTKPVMAKIRVDGHSSDRFNHEVAAAIADSGVDACVVHGRHWRDDYSVAVNYQDITYFVNELTIPVIGNGDVCDLPSLRQMQATGCAGVMISRAGMGQPWITAHFDPPSIQTRGRILITHVEYLASLLNSEKMALFELRKFAKYYARHCSWQAAFVSTLQQIQHKQSLLDLVHQFFLTDKKD